MNVSTFQPSGVREVNKHLDALELRAEFQGHTADTNWPVGQFATRLPDGVLYAFNSEEKFDAYVTLFKQDADAAHASIGWEVSFPEETSPDIPETTQSTPEPFLGVFVTNESSEGIDSKEDTEAQNVTIISLGQPDSGEGENGPQVMQTEGVLESVEATEHPRPPAPSRLSSRCVGRPKSGRALTAAERQAASRARLKAQRAASGTLSPSVLVPPRARGTKKTKSTRAVSSHVLDQKIIQQNSTCVYCENKFASPVLKENVVHFLKAVPDHFKPRAIRLDNSSDNIVAACHVCNGIKSDHVFDSIQEARPWLQAEWTRRGYAKCPPLIPYVRSEINNYN